jgi:lysocardiolipin and lysophospholipid acyltransferase
MEAFEPVPIQHLSPNRPKPSFKQKILVVIRVVLTTIMTIFVNIFVLTAKLLFPILGRKRYRQLCDYVQQAWFDAAFVLLSKTKMHVYGQNKYLHVDNNDKRPRIVIANHATDMDWFYLWMIAHTCDTPRSGHVKVMLKEGVKHIPLFGWLLDRLDFLWMKRDWESDKSAIHQTIKKLCSDDEHLWLLMFPEGMTVNTKSRDKSQAFAKTENRPHLEMTLLPRDKGLSAVLQSTKHLHPEIVDVTLAFESFSGEIPTWEMGYERNKDHLIPNAKKIMAGMAGDVFMEIQTFHADEVIHYPGGIKKWLDDRWVRKDQYLKYFAENETFPIEDSQKEMKVAEGSLKRLGVILLCDAVIFTVVSRASAEVWKIIKSRLS